MNGHRRTVLVGTSAFTHCHTHCSSSHAYTTHRKPRHLAQTLKRGHSHSDSLYRPNATQEPVRILPKLSKKVTAVNGCSYMEPRPAPQEPIRILPKQGFIYLRVQGGIFPHKPSIFPPQSNSWKHFFPPSSVCTSFLAAINPKVHASAEWVWAFFPPKQKIQYETLKRHTLLWMIPI